MKKLYYLLAGIAMVLVVVIACEKSSIDVEEMQAIEKVELSAKGQLPKVTICHYDWEVDEYYQISVNGNSVDKHKANHRYNAAWVQITDENFVGDVVYFDSEPDFEPDLDDFIGVAPGDYDGDLIADCADCNDDIANPGGNSEKTLKYYKDFDGDGFGDVNIFILKCDVEGLLVKYTKDEFDYVLEIDCNDNDDKIYPGAPELCDGLDNDCDDVVPADEIDGDGDGFLACEDCDDDNDTVYPGAPELCDGLDNDCDDVVPTDEIDDDGDGLLACEDCDDNWYAFSPFGDYILLKVNSAGETDVLRYYDITIGDLDENRDFTGSGTETTRNWGVDIIGHVDVSGEMTLTLTHHSGNCWFLTGTVGECGGINFIELSSARPLCGSNDHAFSLFTE